MNLEEIKKRVQPQPISAASFVGTSISLPSLQEVGWLIAEVERLTAKCEERGDMLEDVVNELDISDGMVEQHGPMGTAPATLVRLVLARKDQEIATLKSGMNAAEVVRG
jgi:hypothetical protein